MLRSRAQILKSRGCYRRGAYEVSFVLRSIEIEVKSAK